MIFNTYLVDSHGIGHFLKYLFMDQQTAVLLNWCSRKENPEHLSSRGVRSYYGDHASPIRHDAPRTLKSQASSWMISFINHLSSQFIHATCLTALHQSMASSKRSWEGNIVSSNQQKPAHPKVEPNSSSAMASENTGNEEGPVIQSIFENFRSELDEHHDRRERIIKASRDITALSKKMYDPSQYPI